MLKALKDRWPLLALFGVSTLSVGLIVTFLKTTDAFNPSAAVVVNPNVSTEQSSKAVQGSTVLGLAKQPAEARGGALSKIAQQGNGIEGDRARYMLATDLINQGQGQDALPLIEGLERSYTDMAPYILLRRGQAQTAAGDAQAAQSTWTQLLTQYAGSGAAAEALFELGNQTANASDAASQQANAVANDYWNTLLREVPSHPRSVDIALKRISESANTPDANPPATAAAQTATNLDELSLLKLVAKHGINHPQYTKALDLLTNKYSNALTADDWAAVGFGYWENQVYGKAGEAYAKAPGTPTSQYRTARGQQRGGKAGEALAGYQRLNQTFPEAPETAEGLLKLANIAPKPIALSTLDQVIERFPDRAAEALLIRADLLDDMKSPDSAKQARSSILTQYPSSETAAEIRLKNAKARAKKGDMNGAINWAQQVTTTAPKTEPAAEAGFWLGKWALRRNQPDAARRSFEQVIRNHPESYYAWRSAVHLDWAVGDFDNVRNFMPDIAIAPRRSPLPAGSTTLQELYLLGHDYTAWNQWQTEFVNQQEPTVSEQFTDGVLRLGINDNLAGIFMVSSLAWRDRPEEISEYNLLKETPEYGHAIYPFPYADLILGYAQQRQLNPLLVTALVRQESRFQASIQSIVGAVGLMQVMPETGEWIAQKTGETSYSLSNPADNVKFGTWYLDSTHREFNNNSLFAVASYNAGPGSVDKWIKEGGFSNADEFVEKIPYPETKGYISSVFGGYWNYLRLYNPEIAAKVAEL
ncbi:MAG: transglycosylase SLT domain-containing protein [Cyanobacteria bacterium P01_F01_bin.53]